MAEGHRTNGKHANNAIVQDITKRKEAEDRFRLLVEQAGDAFFVLDYDGAIQDINDQA